MELQTGTMQRNQVGDLQRLLNRARREVRRLLLHTRFLYWRLALGRRMRVAGFVFLARRLVLEVYGSGFVDFGSDVILSHDVHIEAYGALRIGARTFVGHGTTIVCAGSVTIGEDSLIGEYVCIRDSNHEFGDFHRLIREQGSIVAPVFIGSNVWIGAKATLVAGVHVGSGCVIGANAVVTRDIPPNSIAVGIPARVIEQRGEG